MLSPRHPSSLLLSSLPFFLFYFDIDDDAYFAYMPVRNCALNNMCKLARRVEKPENANNEGLLRNWLEKVKVQAVHASLKWPRVVDPTSDFI